MDLSVLPRNVFLSCTIHLFHSAKYFSYIEVPKYRRALFLSRFNAFPTAVTKGRYGNISFEWRLCSGGVGGIEMLSYCSFYPNTWQELLSPFLVKHPGHSDSSHLQLLVSNQSDSFFPNVAKCTICHSLCLNSA